VGALGVGGGGSVGHLSYKGDNVKGKGDWTPDNSFTTLAWINCSIFSPDQNVITIDNFKQINKNI
jgi:hypothetical protein